MRVTVLAPDVSGGGMTRAYWIARLAAALGHDVEVAGPLIREREVYPAPPAGLRVTPVEDGPLPALVARLAAPLGADLLYAIKPLRSSFGVALHARRAQRRPLALDIDDWEAELLDGGAGAPRSALRALRDPRRALHGAAWRLRVAWGRAHRVGARRLASRCAEADAITVNTRALAARFGGIRLPSGKDTALFDPARHDPEASRARLGLAGHRVLLFPGTVQPHKGLEDLLDALDALGWPDLRLVIAGGRRSEHLDALMRRGARWIVRLPRHGLAEMPGVVAAAHVVAIPQRDGPISRAQFPMKLTDAMAMAKPVLCTAVGDVPEIVGDTAWVVEPGRPDCIAAALREILGDPEAAARRGARARARCLERLSVEANRDVFAAVIERACRRAGGG